MIDDCDTCERIPCQCAKDAFNRLHGATPTREDGRLIVKRARILELEAENERLHLRIATLEADLREERRRV